MRKRELGPYKSKCGREGDERERELGPYKSKCGREGGKGDEREN